jgi:hypothetical protein
MHYTPKVSPSRLAMRKATLALLSRSSCSAWLDAAGEGEAFSRHTLMPRLRVKLAGALIIKRSTRGKSDVRCAH